MSAEQAQPSSDSSSDETKSESASGLPEQAEEDDDEVQITIPNAFEVSGDPDCVQCTGNGEVDCPVCNGTGFFTLTIMETVSSSQCRMCSGRKIIPCPTCRQIVFKSVLWWDQIPSEEEDPEEKWRDGPDGPKFRWGENPAGS
ncbi:Heat shock protein DnaJ [Gracilaria domingensis]|nr:Heat shock protein DnaJ [Gracilaria domingensis]